MAEWLKHSPLALEVLGSRQLICEIFKNSPCLPKGEWATVRVGEEGGKEEEWHPTTVILLLVKVGSLTASLPHHHWLRDNL